MSNLDQVTEQVTDQGAVPQTAVEPATVTEVQVAAASSGETTASDQTSLPAANPAPAGETTEDAVEADPVAQAKAERILKDVTRLTGSVEDADYQVINTTGYQTGVLYKLSPHALKLNPEQPRKNADKKADADLETSVRQHGVICPILCRLNEHGELVVVAGERRTKAAIAAGLQDVPVVITDRDDHELLSLVENIQRADLSAMEFAEYLALLQAQTKYQGKDLAAMIGKSPSVVSEALSLVRLPDDIKAEVRGNNKYSRQMLLGVVGKTKSAIEMKKRFEELKGSLANPTQPKSRAEMLKEKVDAFTKILDGFDMAKIDDKGRSLLIGSFDELMTLLTEKRGAAA